MSALKLGTFLEISREVELIAISHKSRGKMYVWFYPNVPGISSFGKMCLGMACLYAPRIMDRGGTKVF